MFERFFEIASMVYYAVWIILTIADLCSRKNP